MQLEDDVVPAVNLRRYNSKSYLDNSMLLWVPSTRGNVTAKVSWAVGGSITIDSTELIVGPWTSLPTNLVDDGDGGYPSAETLKLIAGASDEFHVIVPSISSGKSRWHADGPSPLPSDAADALNPVFEAEISTAAYPPANTLAVFARAQVDRDWLVPAAHVSLEGAGPASHVVNARRNPAYAAANAGKVVRGRPDDWWYSAPVSLRVGAGPGEEAEVLREAVERHAPTREASERGGVTRVVHVNARSSYLTRTMKAVASGENSKSNGATRGNDSRKDDKEMSDSQFVRGKISLLTEERRPILLVALAVGAAIAVVIAIGLKRRRRFQRVKTAAEEEDFSVVSYRDNPLEEGKDNAEVGLQISPLGRQGVSA